jgi:hypothetical protein
MQATLDEVQAHFTAQVNAWRKIFRQAGGLAKTVAASPWQNDNIKPRKLIIQLAFASSVKKKTDG